MQTTQKHGREVPGNLATKIVAGLLLIAADVQQFTFGGAYSDAPFWVKVSKMPGGELILLTFAAIT